MKGTKERLEREKMDWNNIYITGQPGFKREVSRKLEYSDLSYMPGYLGSTPGDIDHDMYWVDKETELRDFKQGIGAKLIWKYRLRFYTSLEALHATRENSLYSTALTQREQNLIEEMRKAS